MISKLVNWLKTHKLSVFLSIVIVYMLFSPGNPIIYSLKQRMLGNTPYYFESGMSDVAVDSYGIGAPETALMYGKTSNVIYNQPAPVLDNSNRKMVTNSNFSLQVQNVTDSTGAIKAKTTEFGGYVVNVYLNRPEFGDTATVEVRIPNDKVDPFVSFLRLNAVKVVSENVIGYDVTDSYVDIQERLTQLEKQKATIEAILAKAVTVDELIKVRPYLQQIQDEIDSYKGQLKYIENTTSTSLVTIYLATDELSLPYTPSKSWRPSVIFKEAVRSLFGTLQNLGSSLIWLGVYSIIIVPVACVIALIWLVKKRKPSSDIRPN